jgi:hypothetical protein
MADRLTGKARDPGRTAADNRLFVSGVLWVPLGRAEPAYLGNAGQPGAGGVAR